MLKTYLKTVLSTIWPNRALQPPSTFLLGRPHDLSTPAGLEVFEAEFRMHLLFTYRHSIRSLAWTKESGKENWVRSLLTKHRLKRSCSSDGGWGCTIRVFQMAMAQVLLSLYLTDGRWSETSLEELTSVVAIVNHFCDTETAPFSIHSITSLGQKRLQLPLTAWYGPTSCASVMSILLNDLGTINGREVRCLHFDDTCINVTEVSRAICEVQPSDGMVVILLSMRLGLDHIDLAKHKSFLTDLFKLKQFNGLCGGDSKTSAYYFIACNDDFLYFLDPHVKVQTALLSVRLQCGGATDRGAKDDDDIYLVLNENEKLTLKQCAGVLLPDRSRQLAWRALNPSMTVTFLCNSAKDLVDLRQRLGHTIYFDEKDQTAERGEATACHGDEEYLLV